MDDWDQGKYVAEFDDEMARTFIQRVCKAVEREWCASDPIGLEMAEYALDCVEQKELADLAQTGRAAEIRKREKQA